MRNKFGTFLMILGAAMIMGALALLIYNQREAAMAQKATAEVLPQVIAEIETRKQEKQEATQGQTDAMEQIMQEILPSLTEKPVVEMTELEIAGNKYIGYLSIPILELDLPVMSDWSYPKLKQAPCRYVGTVENDNLVIMAHNYAYHFGELSELAEGDTVFFTDAEGVVTVYEVIVRDILNPTAVEEVTAGDFDLVLFTCTYGGQSRVTVYCDRMRVE